MCIVIIGAGITGLTCAWKLSELSDQKVVLIEKEEAVGGLIRTIHKDGFSFDLGSHRIHNLYPPDIFETITTFCNDDILKRKRNGLLLSNQKFIKYPPSISNILTGFGLKDFLKLSLDYIARFPNRIQKARIGIESYESYMISMVGRGIYERLFKPYAIKLWGLDPTLVAPNPAISRNGNFELPLFLKELLRKLRKGYVDYYYYPRKGIGVLAENIKKEFLANGGELFLETRINEIKSHNRNRINVITVSDFRGETWDINVNTLISTIDQENLLDLIETTGLRQKTQPCGKKLSYRSLRLIYIETKDNIPSRNETHYFPEPKYLIGRVSELNKYSPSLNKPNGCTILTVEIPCTVNDTVWKMTDDELFARCKKELVAVNLLKGEAVNTRLCYSRKLTDVYPVYKLNYKALFREKYNYLNTYENLFLVGRNALFLHCNIDHCMRMALDLSHLISSQDDESKEKEKWLKISEDFFKFRLRY